MSNKFYILRYSLPPEPVDCQQKRLDLLVEVCKQAKIDEVMFFVLPEEYNRGQWRKADYAPWLDFIVKAKAVVEEMGLSTSLNPWHTLLHVDRGRKSEDLDYRRMVMDTGETCTSVACPSCPQWKEIFFSAFRDFARTGFKTIWVEDDFRFHNHGYGWGGCFCDEHISELRKRGAVATTREELISNLNAEGWVHPDRSIWISMMSEAHLEIAKSLREIVDEIDSSINLGLMCSQFKAHALEGRDSLRLLEALGGAENVPVRPHAAPYMDTCGCEQMLYMANLSMSLEVLPKNTKTYFEIENHPMSRFSKSSDQTVAQMAFAVEGGCDGLTLDVLDMFGTGPDSEPYVIPMLCENKEKLISLKNLSSGKEAIGIKNILPLDTAKLSPGTGEANLHSIPNIDYGWFVFLQSCGYPCINTNKVPENSKMPISLSDSSVYAIEKKTLKSMLGNRLCLIDSKAAGAIYEMGMGGLIGIKKLTCMSHSVHPFSFEQAIERSQEQIPERAGLNLAGPTYKVSSNRSQGINVDYGHSNDGNG